MNDKIKLFKETLNERLESLANYLGIDVNDIEIKDSISDSFPQECKYHVGENQYYILTKQETREYLLDLIYYNIRDYGITYKDEYCVFDDDFRTFVINECIDKEYLEKIMYANECGIIMNLSYEQLLQEMNFNSSEMDYTKRELTQMVLSKRMKNYTIQDLITKFDDFAKLRTDDKIIGKLYNWGKIENDVLNYYSCAVIGGYDEVDLGNGYLLHQIW